MTRQISDATRTNLMSLHIIIISGCCCRRRRHRPHQNIVNRVQVVFVVAVYVHLNSLVRTEKYNLIELNRTLLCVYKFLLESAQTRSCCTSKMRVFYVVFVDLVFCARFIH